MPSATLIKFGYPATVVGETAHWTVLVRPQQPTFGSLVLVCREAATAFGAVSPGAFADLSMAVARIEVILRDFVAYEKINYLMLMMVDPDVHFHVIPRYAGVREHDGLTYPDAGWPGPPVLGQAVEPDEARLGHIVAALRERWGRQPPRPTAARP